MGSDNRYSGYWATPSLHIPELNPELLPDFLNGWLESGAILAIPTGDPSPEGDGIQFLLGVGKKSSRREPSSFQPSFYANDFFLRDERPWQVYPGVFRASRRTLLDALKSFATPASGPRLEWQEPDRNSFDASFSELQQLFKQGKLVKAVPVVFEQARLRPSRSHLAHWLWRALDYSKDLPAHVYGAWDQSEGTVGVTPEILFDLPRPGRVSTVALAGTRRDPDRELLGSLLEDPKELREHDLVIQGIFESLQDQGLVLQYPTEELRLPGLSHLRTRIELSTEREMDFSTLVERMHPTPALGACPGPAGKDWLLRADERGPIPRESFGAPFGASWAGGGSDCFARCVVGIRNLRWRHERILCGAGCGVIAESRLDREWLELQGKIRAVKGIFGFL